MIEIGTEPRAGTLEWLDNERNRVSWTELRTSFHLLYKHTVSCVLNIIILLFHYFRRQIL